MTDELRAIGDKARFSTTPSVCRQMYDGQFLGWNGEESDSWDLGHTNMRELVLMCDFVKGMVPILLYEADWENFKFAAYQFENESDARRFFEARKKEFESEYSGEPWEK